ncbi:MAG: hypothetical protein RDV00_05170 [Clostridia bacterium]|nr:hypothetical protein [Clostridia bacterium]MDQ7791503.1 hypothetical protein [Clostridia bacterium]
MAVSEQCVKQLKERKSQVESEICKTPDADEVFAAERKEDLNVLIIVLLVFLLCLLFPNQVVYFFKEVLYFV